jgi:hypothetical protein
MAEPSGTVDIDSVRPIDEPPMPEPAGGLAGYVAELRSLRIWAGNPTFQTLARRSEVPRSTLADALDPGRRTLPRLEVVNAFAIACGLPHEPVLQWQRVWRQIQQSAVAPEPASGAVDGAAVSAASAGSELGRPRDCRHLDTWILRDP